MTNCKQIANKKYLAFDFGIGFRMRDHRIWTKRCAIINAVSRDVTGKPLCLLYFTTMQLLTCHSERRLCVVRVPNPVFS